MRRNVTIGFSEDEFLRLQGAAAIAKMPLASYLRWLLQSGSGKGAPGGDTTAVLGRLDEVLTAIAKLAIPQPRPRSNGHSQMPLPLPPGSPHELIALKLRDRGIPS